jgi:hypothetical protein
VDDARLADVLVDRVAGPEWWNTLSFLFGRFVRMFPEPAYVLMQELRLRAARTVYRRTQVTGLKRPFCPRGCSLASSIEPRPAASLALTAWALSPA